MTPVVEEWKTKEWSLALPGLDDTALCFLKRRAVVDRFQPVLQVGVAL